MIEKPAKAVLWSWIGLAAVILLPLTGLLGWLVWLFLPEHLLILLALWSGILALFLGVYLPWRQRSMRFCLEEGEITVTGGVLVTTTRRMRIDAVRQITLLQGPLERRFDTAFLLISATGGHLLVEGIAQNRAEVWIKQVHPS